MLASRVLPAYPVPTPQRLGKTMTDKIESSCDNKKPHYEVSKP